MPGLSMATRSRRVGASNASRTIDHTQILDLGARFRMARHVTMSRTFLEPPRFANADLDCEKRSTASYGRKSASARSVLCLKC